jgi:hypothetical protein
MDKGVEYEQNLTGRNIAIIILRRKSNRLGDLGSYIGLSRSDNLHPTWSSNAGWPLAFRRAAQIDHPPIYRAYKTPERALCWTEVFGWSLRYNLSHK